MGVNRREGLIWVKPDCYQDPAIRENSGSDYHEIKYLVQSKLWEIMDFQREILAKSLAKSYFAMRFFSH